ncbi:hypothetical protein BH10PSE1_BH10PSE1_25840 [soil metagenome]
MPNLRRVHLRRSRMLEKDGGATLFCVMTYRGEPGPALAFLRPGQFPEFDGEEAWFEVRWFNKGRREFVRRLEAAVCAG